MKKITGFIFLSVALITLVGCGGNKNENINPSQPSYNTEATAEDEGVQITESGSLIVPSYSEAYGSSNGKLIVTTPDNDGNYDVLIYNFPNSTLESVTYEMHFAHEEQAKNVFEEKKAANAADLTLESNVVTYTDTDSKWIGYKKRDLIDNLSKTWEQLGYQVVNE